MATSTTLAQQSDVAECLDDAGAWWRTADTRKLHPTTNGDVVPWQVVASAEVIVRGVIRLSAKDRVTLLQRRREFVSPAIEVSDVLKGSGLSRGMTLQYPAVPEYTGPEPEKLIAAANVESIFFLVEDANNPGSYYFAGHRAGSLLVDATGAAVQSVRVLMSEMDGLAERTTERMATFKSPYDQDVAELIDRTTLKRGARSAACQLLALGPDAAPALIQRMDDQRELALSYVSLRAPPDYFESLVHYSPKEVVDLVSIVLSYSVGESFGFINSGGSERERRRVIKAWRIWLGKELGL